METKTHSMPQNNAVTLQKICILSKYNNMQLKTVSLPFMLPQHDTLN